MDHLKRVTEDISADDLAILLNEIVRRAELYYSRWRSD